MILLVVSSLFIYIGNCQCSFDEELVCIYDNITIFGWMLRIFNQLLLEMLCFKFGFLMIFENFDIFKYLIEINKIDAKIIKMLYFTINNWNLNSQLIVDAKQNTKWMQYYTQH